MAHQFTPKRRTPVLLPDADQIKKLWSTREISHHAARLENLRAQDRIEKVIQSTLKEDAEMFTLESLRAAGEGILTDHKSSTTGTKAPPTTLTLARDATQSSGVSHPCYEQRSAVQPYLAPLADGGQSRKSQVSRPRIRTLHGS